MEDINKKLYEKAIDIGISKNEYYHKYKFNIFDIKDMEYEKKHANISHVHIDGKKCDICSGRQPMTDGTKNVARPDKKMEVN